MEASKEKDFKTNKSEKNYLHRRKADEITRLKKNESLETFQYLKQYRQEIREKEEEAGKNQSKELSLIEKELLVPAKEIETAQLKKNETAKNRIADEKKEAVRIKKRLQNQKQQKTEASNGIKSAKRQAYLKQYRQKQREEYEFLRRESVKLQSENRELSLNEKEIVIKAQEAEAARLKKIETSKEYRLKTISAVTPEDIRKKKEAVKLLRSDDLKHKSIQEATDLLNNPEMSSEQREILKLAVQIKIARFKKIKNRNKRYDALTPEEKEVFRLKRCLVNKKHRELEALKPPRERKNDTEYQKKYRERKREKEELLRTEAAKLLSLNRELSLNEKETLRQAKEMEDKRVQRNISTSRRFRKPYKRIDKKKEEGLLTSNEQTISNFAFAINEIKIEKEELQETTINAIPARLQKDLYNSSSFLMTPSAKRLKADERNHRYFRAFNVGERILNCKTDIGKNDDVEDILSCMRALIENVAKGDEFAVFGKHIAQKMRSSIADPAEANIAKSLIENILQNLAIGLYNSDNQIV